MIYLCNLWDMPKHVAELHPSGLISLVAPEEQPLTPAEIPAERHLRLAVHDITEPRPGQVAPAAEHVSALIEFLNQAQGQSVLIHCVAGISRSTAAALVALVLDAEGREMEAACRLRQAAPHAYPNRRLIALADRLLGRRGRLIAACEAMGPAEGLSWGPLVRLPRLR